MATRTTPVRLIAIEDANQDIHSGAESHVATGNVWRIMPSQRIQDTSFDLRLRKGKKLEMKGLGMMDQNMRSLGALQPCDMS